jgi:putative endonuclease
MLGCYPQTVGVSGLLLDLERNLYLRLRQFADRRTTLRAQRVGKRPTPQHLVTGERGEDLAFFHLRGLGYTIVARRWVSARVRGDLDLVAWDGNTLVIIEVKTRTARDLFPAEAEVNAAKQRQLRRMTGAWLAQLPARHRARIPVRFDVVSVYLTGASPEFEHIPNAFSYRDTGRNF